MYSREQRSQVRQEFWTSFGKYMGPVPSAGGEHINWVNYKTGVKYIFLRMNAESDGVYVALEITHPDPISRQLYFEQLTNYKSLLAHAGQWEWNSDAVKENGVLYCAIAKKYLGVNIFRKSDWPQMISFLKSSIIDLDAYWYITKDLIEIL